MPVIEVDNLYKRYGDQVAVDDLSFTIEKGEIFGILGPNGAGKTTTVEIIEGLRTPDRGTVRVLGLDPQRDGEELRRTPSPTWPDAGRRRLRWSSASPPPASRGRCSPSSR